MPSFKASISTIFESKPTTNGQTFATREEAQASGDELMSRWTLVKAVAVVEGDWPVNYRFVNGHNERIEEESIA